MGHPNLFLSQKNPHQKPWRPPFSPCKSPSFWASKIRSHPYRRHPILSLFKPQQPQGQVGLEESKKDWTPNMILDLNPNHPLTKSKEEFTHEDSPLFLGCPKYFYVAFGMEIGRNKREGRQLFLESNPSWTLQALTNPNHLVFK